MFPASPTPTPEPAATPRRASYRRRLVHGIGIGVRDSRQTLLVLFVGLAATGVVWQQSLRVAQEALSDRLEDRADRIGQAVEDQFAEAEKMLYTARAMFYASDYVSHRDWEIFTEGLNIGRNAPGMFALGFVQRVPRDGLDAFLAQAAADGVPLALRPHAGADVSLDAVDEHYIIKYSEPGARNHLAVGVDLSTHSRNARAYRDSAETGQTRVATGFPLTQAPHHGQGFVLALPVYTPEVDASDPARTAVIGWVTGAMLIDRMIEQGDHIPMAGFLLEIDINDEEEVGRVHRLFTTQPGAHDTTASLTDPDAVRHRYMSMFGRSMRLKLTPANTALTRPDTTRASVTLLIGCLATALLAMITQSTTRTRVRAERLAHQMTTSLRLGEQRQRELARRAEQANRAKSEFLANMSHEIRTPMTAILGYADLLGSGEADPELVAESVGSIRQAGRHLLMLINDVLDLSKIESGQLSVEAAPCDLHELIGSVVTTLGPLAARKGITLTATLEASAPIEVMTDQNRVRQVLINLVGNAVKFTESGGVVVQAAYNAGVLELAVHDTGVGITPDQLERIFLAFEQADNSASRRHEGTGLGLAISRRLAELLDGGLAVRSVPGEGSVFTLRIPAPACDAPPIGAVQARRSAPTDRTTTAAPQPRAPLVGRVLLAEDGPDNQRLISFILRKAGL